MITLILLGAVVALAVAHFKLREEHKKWRREIQFAKGDLDMQKGDIYDLKRFKEKSHEQINTLKFQVEALASVEGYTKDINYPDNVGMFMGWRKKK